VRDRPHFATLFGIAVILASVVNLGIIYGVTHRNRAVIHATVAAATAKGVPTTIARPKESLDSALRKGDVATVKQHMYWCLKEGTCNLDKELRVAVSTNDATITKVLLAAGAKVNATDKDKETALHSAASGGSTMVAEVLLEAGADVNARDEEGLTPLHTAAAWGHVELTRVLLAAGADVNASSNSRQTPLHMVASRRVPPLSVYADVAKLLLDAGARPNQRAADGSTPLRLAEVSASRLSLDGNVKATGDANEVVSLLRERGARD
jgi:hypothetical protein